MPDDPFDRREEKDTQAFSKSERLLNRGDFVNLNRSGKRYSGRHFTILLKQNRLEKTRLGVTVSKKVGNAVERNRVKRLIREFFRLRKSLFPQKHDVVIAAKRGAGELNFWNVNEELGDIFADKRFHA